uniref:ARAD1C22924p n=1 Tax=Blastobotrys adeninivorans TaxID=409370 RepID=A0A060T268_BLAAD
MTVQNRQVLIGVDVGGTNTDSVLLDPNEFDQEHRGVLAWNKSVTTNDVSEGIEAAIAKLLDESTHTVNRSDVAAVAIGTTHFINAVIEQDQGRLERVAVLRLCGPYSKAMPPFSDFPEGLKAILDGYQGFLNGGHHVDGQEIQPVDEQEVLQHVAEIKKLGLQAVAVTGVFSPMTPVHEQKVAEIVQREIPGVQLVMSHEVSGIGYLERENATILNAAIMSFAQKIITSFTMAIQRQGLKCPVVLSQNDGTIITAAEAMNTPIRTFSSGATNSMRGAAFLCSKEKETHGKSIMVVDVGGTTTDVGLLLPSGFPRQSSSYSIVGGVRMNFSMPHVESIGLGGGSIVRINDNEISIGPDSVGNNIAKAALVFGGDTVTATDVTIAKAVDEPSTFVDALHKIGTPQLVEGKFTSSVKTMFDAGLKRKVESVIDRMKTSPDPLPVLLVGGGSFIVPDELNGASKVFRPPYFGVANAIGAAMGKLSTEAHSIQVVLPGVGSREAISDELKNQAMEAVIAKGAIKSSVSVVDVRVDAVPYVPNTFSFYVKAVGDVDYNQMKTAFAVDTTKVEENGTAQSGGSVTKRSTFDKQEFVKTEETMDYSTYKPFINENREWILSQVDLDFLSIGVYILGCGGGGHPYSHYLEVRNMLRQGATIRIIDMDDLPKYITDEKGSIVSVGYAGSPTVSAERLAGNELWEANELLAQFIGKRPEAVYPLEIGGGNGLQGIFCASDKQWNVPTVDCDLMGRAYPTHWQTLPVVFNEGKPYFAPCTMSDGNGNTVLIAQTKSDLHSEKIIRASLSELGASVGVVNPPMTVDQVKDTTVKNTVSQAWRIGRAVMIARQKSEINMLPRRIIDAVGGDRSAKQLFAGKIVSVDKYLFKGHVYGEVVIESENGQQMLIPFKNENILCKLRQGRDDQNPKIVCSVPDLISVIDADTGEAVGTPDYRYGLVVFVLAIAPSDRWTSTPKGLEIGGPKAFDLDDVEYRPIGEYTEPMSVIKEYATVPSRTAP